MRINPYIGHYNQMCGVEDVILTGGKSTGMHLLQIRNRKRLELIVSSDRCADVSRVTFKGENIIVWKEHGGQTNDSVNL